MAKPQSIWLRVLIAVAAIVAILQVAAGVSAEAKEQASLAAITLRPGDLSPGYKPYTSVRDVSTFGAISARTVTFLHDKSAPNSPDFIYWIVANTVAVYPTTGAAHQAFALNTLAIPRRFKKEPLSGHARYWHAVSSHPAVGDETTTWYVEWYPGEFTGKHDVVLKVFRVGRYLASVEVDGPDDQFAPHQGDAAQLGRIVASRIRLSG